MQLQRGAGAAQPSRVHFHDVRIDADPAVWPIQPFFFCLCAHASGCKTLGIVDEYTNTYLNHNPHRPNHFFFFGFTPSSLATSGAGNAVGSSTSPNSDCFTGGNEGSFHVTDLSEFAVPGREP